MGMFELAGKTAVITGGASGIGLAVAKACGAAGMNIVIGDVQHDAMQAAEAALQGAGYPTLVMRCDVRTVGSVTDMADAAEDLFGDVHLLHNNAGVVAAGRTEEISDDAWQWVMDVNLWGPIHGCRVFLPRMLAHGEPSHIVNTASMAGLDSGPLMAPYFVTKFGTVALSESVWHEQRLANTNVGVSVLCPGFVRTGIAESSRNAPSSVGDWVTPGSEMGAGFAAMLRAGVEGGKDASEIAAAVLDAVREDRFWILPHADQGSLQTVEARAAAIVDGKRPNSRWDERLGGSSD